MPDELKDDDWYYTYVLWCHRTEEFYTGATQDLDNRLQEHKSNQVRSTRHKEPELIYYEACLNKDDAFRRERYLKSGNGKKFLRNRIKKYLSE